MTRQRTTSPVLEVRGLQTVFHDVEGAWPAINSLDLTVHEGEILGLVGESGSGKSVTGFSILGLIDPPGEITRGEVCFKGRDLRRIDAESLRQIRGSSLAMIFQDPLTTLNPVLTIGQQMAEAITEHEKVEAAEVRRRCIDGLNKVGITSPEKRVDQYPHELSGGMRQRVAIAIALLNSPDLIIADEPTTALDVTIQGQIIAEVQRLQQESGAALIWISHDLGVVAELADRIAVMYAGDIVEMGSTDDVLDRPRHPYTRGLLDSVPGDVPAGEPLRQIEGAAPPLFARPAGCGFAPRCDHATELCRREEPLPAFDEKGRSWRCHHPLSVEETV
ncbi:ABC transporter ATP-binding protein [Chelativorans sp. AA-79]|uniref:ABC transporter ATP-binding protein n=1 Tax=Chelativorans sp. AA-79 TaxID=3028735 RepID=UPI0023F72002|nr:ABC transporter ATP-binding protein [Chelativorans sp. AA-79]WEX11012.1 ABC transporter ATP-binding protein [Chelativorans sp. AA-79]